MTTESLMQDLETAYEGGFYDDNCPIINKNATFRKVENRRNIKTFDITANKMPDKTPTRGGARPNAGRPKVADKAKSHTICLRDAHWRKFKELGGVSWLRLLLDNDQ